LLKQISDKKRLQAFLETDPFLHIYSIGDLDDFFWSRTTWYAWVKGDAIKSLFLLYRGDNSVPTLVALEERNLEDAIVLLERLCPLLPESFYGHFSTHLLPDLGRRYVANSTTLHLKMKLEKKWFSPVLQPEKQPIIPLQQSDLTRLLKLYEEAYPGNWFDPRMLETNQYLGIEIADRIVAVAGIHVYSPQYKVAALGNITTHPDFRGKGLSTVLTSCLCERLFETVDWIGLNVAASNKAAIRCYSKIGFSKHCTFEEIFVTGRVSGRS
jgi:ribosomal protein S18 acetylase RimI-like enzyme